MISTHGLGGGQDLPLPAPFAIAGGTAALVLSFVILMLAWRKPRWTDTSNGRAGPHLVGTMADSRVLAITLRTAGLVLFAYVVLAAAFGQDLATNPTFGVVYIWLWVGIVPTSLLFGPFYKAVSPVRSIHAAISKVARSDPEDGLFSLPAWVGCWPAAIGLFAFVWLELVYPNNLYLGPARLWFALYSAITVIGSLLFGTRWLEQADPFEAYSTLLGRFSIWGRTDEGRLILRNPMRNLAGLPMQPGRVAMVAVLLGSTAFDSFRASNSWLRFTQSTDASVATIETGLLLAACSIVGFTFTAATYFGGGDHDKMPRRQHPIALAHSIVPIIVGYMVAHYLTYFVETGQLTLAQLSDPLTNGSDLLGTADYQVNYWLSRHPTFLATTKVVAIVTGHVLGVIAAHDRSMQILPGRRRLTGQLPLLAAMTLYTWAGLFLLFGA